MKEPTKKDVLDIAEYLGCNGEELWSEISKLLTQQNDYALKNGFYAGQANAGVELDECHENWKKWNNLGDTEL